MEANLVKKRWTAFVVGLFLVSLLIPVNPTMATEVKLHIPPVFQERPSWTWVAVGEMVFKYYYVPVAHPTDYQCGIAQGRKLCIGMPDCLECAFPPSDDITMVNMLEQYPVMATQGRTTGDIALAVQSKSGTLSEAEVKDELDHGRPIIAEVSPRGFKVDDIPQHMALIVGYDDRTGEVVLTVNDPFPFEDDRYMWIGSPYPRMKESGANDGQYEIRLERFRTKLKWTKTIYGIRCTGQGCPPENHEPVPGPSGKDDREVTQIVLAASAGDFKTLQTGHKAVDANTGTTWRSNITFSGANQCLVRDKDDHHGANWSCTFRFVERADAEKAVDDIVNRLRKSLPPGWIGTDLDVDSDTELYTKTDKFSASKPGNNPVIWVYLIDTKKDGRAKVYLSVDNH